ncbi:MAG: sel1 repeat family protein, partial [Lentisphaeria bacterium]|nr:sel1 repeat family protein [Lentisphaeria bacterium]
GYADALTNFGVCLMTGSGTQKDPEMAVKCFRMAAEKGNAMGQYNLARCYAEGIAVKADADAAAKWAEKAAEQGHENAKKLLEQLKK